MSAHWRHLANTIELVLPSAHPVQSNNNNNVLDNSRAVKLTLSNKCTNEHVKELIAI